MGVKLSPIVPKRPIAFEELRHTRIVVDGMQCMYQFLSSIRQPDGTPLMDGKGRVTSHLMGIWTRFSNLMGKQLSLAVVFDGVPPDLKMRELSDRSDRKAAARVKHDEAEDEEDFAGMHKYAKQTIVINDSMLAEAQELLQAMGLPVIQAPCEADAQMALMNRLGDVWAAATTDYDVLLHQSPRMIANLTLSGRRRYGSGKIVQIVPEVVELQEVLSSLKLSQEQLVDLAILVGTDYNPDGVKGIGPKKALKLVQQFPVRKQLQKQVEFDFPWDEIAELFVKMPVDKDYKLVWNPINPDEVKRLLVDKHNFSEERIDLVLKKQSAVPKGQKSLKEFFG
ncbi:MAG: flap endonuclease-1 [Nanoarchaeota archaeon]|nr:flap endonuclease-1 [Nanoarchaeota archaeon]